MKRDDKEFDSYAVSYDKQHGYYDEGQYYVKTKTETIEEALAYVIAGVERTYAVVSQTIKRNLSCCRCHFLCCKNEWRVSSEFCANQ